MWGKELGSLRDVELPAVGVQQESVFKMWQLNIQPVFNCCSYCRPFILMHGETRLCHYFALYFNLFSPQGDEGPLGPPGVPGPEVSFSGLLSYYQLCWLCHEIVVEITWSFNPSGLKWEVICSSRKYCIVQSLDPGHMKVTEQSFTGCWVRLWFYNLFKVSDLEKLSNIHTQDKVLWLETIFVSSSVVCFLDLWYFSMKVEGKVRKKTGHWSRVLFVIYITLNMVMYCRNAVKRSKKSIIVSVSLPAHRVL